MARDVDALKAKIGARVRAKRSALKISQEDAAFRAGISATYLSQIEAGQRNVSIDVLFKLAQTLHIDLSELVDT